MKERRKPRKFPEKKADLAEREGRHSSSLKRPVDGRRGGKGGR